MKSLSEMNLVEADPVPEETDITKDDVGRAFVATDGFTYIVAGVHQTRREPELVIEPAEYSGCSERYTRGVRYIQCGRSFFVCGGFEYRYTGFRFDRWVDTPSE